MLFWFEHLQCLVLDGRQQPRLVGGRSARRRTGSRFRSAPSAASAANLCCVAGFYRRIFTLPAFSGVLFLIWSPSFILIHILAPWLNESRGWDAQQINQWFDVVGTLPLFGTACLGSLALLNWSASRVPLTTRFLFFSFEGRIPRSTLWLVLCITFPVGLVLGFVPYTSRTTGLANVIIWLIYAGWSFFSTWVILAVYCKRWHDCGRSGWMSLILLIPVIGPLWLGAQLGFVRGTRGANQYGSDPLDSPTA